MNDYPRKGMKAKTIRQILRKKINEWADSIEDERVAELVRKNSVVTGGCIASMLLGEKVNDFDVYFRDKETTAAVAHYYVARFDPGKKSGIPVSIFVQDSSDRIKIVCKSAGVASEDGAEADYDYFEGRPEDEAAGYVGEVMQDPGDIEDAYEETEQASLEQDEDGRAPYRPVFLSTNAITLSGRIQLILRFYGEPEEIHENYDFVHCTSYYVHSRKGREALVLRPEAMEALLARELRYVGSRYPICSLIRIRKFVRRGWTINAGQVLKIAWQVNELDLSNISVLEDQLTGVDVAYFVQVVSALKERDPERVNAAYLVEILDRMF